MKDSITFGARLLQKRWVALWLLVFEEVGDLEWEGETKGPLALGVAALAAGVELVQSAHGFLGLVALF